MSPSIVSSPSPFLLPSKSKPGPVAEIILSSFSSGGVLGLTRSVAEATLGQDEALGRSEALFIVAPSFGAAIGPFSMAGAFLGGDPKPVVVGALDAMTIALIPLSGKESLLSSGGMVKFVG
eukprot:CAMPEP_0201528524 /NCGR_PEP_ID=MMETSP0161_2-20130828/38525_1 /ASSEMBLY_ACC=CAM_ASM_000251 /TAXON_ID=180227 /ORGANISM="Neoparamoeba aestuarina, Strain SoJaBio B1-5/56/2" /LENGTH=120 /DNA_ID=CAMNT_0047929821 /DNA_START=195 /DNA_END=557 /DNA_ORIENTATION=-